MRINLNSLGMLVLGGAIAVAAGCGGGSSGGFGASLPSGAVVAFAGDRVPSGWTLCDGRKNPAGQATPDLRDRFVLGAAEVSASGQSGGAPTHDHAGQTESASGATQGTDRDTNIYVPGRAHLHRIAEAPSLPPYVKLAFIMKD